MISGPSNSGKDYSAHLIQKHFPSYQIIHFADPVKQILADSFGITLEELENLKRDSKVTIKGTRFNKKLDIRYILQHFATEGMQGAFGKTIWKTYLLNRIKQNPTDYIIPDFRFKHEDITLDDLEANIYRIRLTTDDINTNSHISENDLDDYDNFDIIIKNDHSKEFEKKLLNFVRYKDLDWGAPNGISFHGNFEIYSHRSGRGNVLKIKDKLVFLLHSIYRGNTDSIEGLGELEYPDSRIIEFLHENQQVIDRLDPELEYSSGLSIQNLVETDLIRIIKIIKPI